MKSSKVPATDSTKGLVLRRVLIPVDFAYSDELVQKALSLAGAHQADLFILHVNPIGKTDAMTPKALQRNNELAEHRLLDLKAQLDYPAEKVFLVVETGSVATHILHCAKQMSVDLIVMGSHGHGAAYNLLVGSVTEGVLRKSDVPLLVIPLKD